MLSHPHSRARMLAAVALFGLLALTASPVGADPPTPVKKKILTFADYDIWRATGGVTLSRDGKYIAYHVGAPGVDGEAVVRHVPSGKEFRFPRGSATGGAPRFTPDGNRVLLPLSPTKAELAKAKADKLKPDEFPKTALALVELAGGKVVNRIPDVDSFQVGGEGAGFLVYRKADAKKADDKTATSKGKGKGKAALPETTGPKTGSDLFIRDLTGDRDRTIEAVTEFSLSHDDKTLVYVVSAKNEAKNGVYVLNPRFGTAAKALKVGAGEYRGLAWDEKQTKLAFYYDDSRVPPANLAPHPRPAGTPRGTVVKTPPAPPKPKRWRVFVWQRKAAPALAPLLEPFAQIPLGASGPGAIIGRLVAATPPAHSPVTEVFGPNTPGMKKGWSLTAGTLDFSDDGSKLFVSTAPERPAPPKTAPAGEFQLDIWHWKDERLQPMQKLSAAADRSRTYGAVVLLDTMQFRQLSDENVSVRQPGVGDWAVATDDRKYRHTTGYAYPLPSDYALVNIRTGARKPVLTAATSGVGMAPDGKHLVGFDGKDWFTISVPGGKKVNLTRKLGVKFFDEEHDTPSTPPAYSGVQWTPDGTFVLVSDRYDIWKLAADGSSAENITKIGRKQHTRFSVLRPRSPEDKLIERTTDLSKPQLLGAVNLRTRDTGFYRLEPGGGAPKLLVMAARAFGTPTKARDAAVYLLTAQTFSDYPDYYITSPDFKELKKVTDINPQVKKYNWGKAELVKYTSTDGVPLQGILVKPENFDPTKKYPMVVYIYERVSQNLHTFRVPTVTRGQIINPTFYASNGYLVLMPDIAYTIGFPGPSAIKCVLPAIQAVADKGYLNENAIGINGQSWGGYQIAYMVTQTNRFKAAVAGAPVSNMISAYGGIRWGSGLPRQFQYERTQSRIGATPWEAPMRYIENSPVFMADRVQTPLLMIHNDQDDAVPWYQGIEYFLALRRLGKEAYLLNYNGEKHNLGNKAAARDFAMRMFQFFEHHLKGKPAPAWMVKGVPFLDRDKEKEQWKKLHGGK